MDIRRRMLFNTDTGMYAIYYTSSDGNIVTPYDTNVFGANIVSNNYIDGQGIISFNGPVTKIGNQAFLNCANLTSVTIPDSVTNIGELTFQSCTGLTSVTIGNSVTEIGRYAFYNCTRLTSITIPDSVTKIGYVAFKSCTGLTSVTIGDGVTSIGNEAFEGCTSLKEFKGKFAEDNGRCLIIDGVLNAFALDCGVTQYTIPESVTTIKDSAFSKCTRLTNIIIPNSVTTIKDSAFNQCTNITSVTIGDSVTTIGYGAFYNCNKLTSITIPDSVTKIGNQAFYFCSRLKSVYCKATTPPSLGGSSVLQSWLNFNIFVPTESVDAYKSATYWSNYADKIVGYNF